MHGSVWGAAANAEGSGGRGIPRGRDCSTLWAPQPPVTSSGDALGREGWRGHLVSPAGLVPPADSLATGPLSAHQELWGTSSVLGLITYFTLVGAQGAPCNLSQRLSQGHGLSCPRWPWLRSANGLPHHFVLLTPCPRLSHVKGGGGVQAFPTVQTSLSPNVSYCHARARPQNPGVVQGLPGPPFRGGDP